MSFPTRRVVVWVGQGMLFFEINVFWRTYVHTDIFIWSSLVRTGEICHHVQNCVLPHPLQSRAGWMIYNLKPKEFGNTVAFSSRGITADSICSSFFKVWNKGAFSSFLSNLNDALTLQKCNILLKWVSSCFTFFPGNLCKQKDQTLVLLRNRNYLYLH